MPQLPDPPFARELSHLQRAIGYYEAAMSLLLRSGEHPEVAGYYGLDRDRSAGRIRFRALFFAARLQPAIEQLEAQTELRVLDLGCGYALESHLLAACGAEVTGLDSSRIKIERARRVLPLWQKALSRPGKLSLEQGEINLYDPEQSFDLVYASATLHHVEPVPDAAAAIARLLRPGGLFVLGEENAGSPVQQLAVQRKIGWRSPRVFRRVHPVTGEVTLFGRENIRTASAWTQLFRPAGLEPLGTRYHRFLPPLDWPVSRLLRAERTMRRLPGVRSLLAIGFVQAYRRTGA